MNFLKKILAESGKLFQEGKPLSFAYPLWEATDTILFSTDLTPNFPASFNIKIDGEI